MDYEVLSWISEVFGNNKFVAVFILLFTAAKYSFYTAYHFQHAKRFGNVVVGTHVKTSDFVHPFGFCSKEYYADVLGFGVVSENAENFNSVLVRKHYVKKNQIR